MCTYMFCYVSFFHGHFGDALKFSIYLPYIKIG